LDCTLRDGGYINDWRFGNLTIRSVISRLDAAGLDFIEIGFLDERCQYDKDRSMFPNIPSIAKTIGNTRAKQAKLVAMIDFDTFNESLLIPVEQSCLYGIRLIFTKDKMDVALEYAKKIKVAGYNLFLNLVSTSSYNDRELLDLVEKINDVGPFGVSIVDTYGLMFNEDMKNYVVLLDHNLRKDIVLGYHSHNNLQMSNANTIEFLNTRLKRAIIVDSTILGMGKNAGNACTELILSYANKAKIKKFDITQALECAYTDIQKFQGSAKWGYKLEFLISAITECSPNWTKQYMGKNMLSIKDICAILALLPYDKKFLPTFFLLR
jgi:4-hydroxy 2-oxovalerate aldolase